MAQQRPGAPVPAQALVGRLPKQCPGCGARYPADFNVCPRDAAPLENAPEDADPLLGEVLADSYEIIRVIGEGGMGRVYEARHCRLHNKRYAVKVLHHALARQSEVVTRFQREAEAASSLDHPNVVQVLDVNRTRDNRPYIVAELLDGEQLGDYLDRVGKVTAEMAAHLLRPVCRALAHAHLHGVVHRDIKPENVVVVSQAPEAVVKVLDFGISKVANTQGTLTKTGMVLGSPGYIAPEQARGIQVDHRVDIYAAGAILYRAVTGTKPFGDLEPMAAMTSVLVKEPPRPRQVEATVPPAFEAIIQRAMSMDAADRYQSMTELDAALAGFDTLDDSHFSLAPGAAATSAELQQATEASPRERRSQKSVHTLEVLTRDVRLARPSLIFFTAAGALWTAGLLAISAGAAIRLFGGSIDVTRSEAAISLSAIVAILILPLALWIKHLNTSVWTNTPRAVALASRLRSTVLWSAAGYGAGALCLELLQTLIKRQSLALIWPGWQLVLLIISVACGVGAWLGASMPRPRKSALRLWRRTSR